jgi:L-aspartate oxidase
VDIIESDVLIIGGGIAGLMAAEYLSLHKNVIIITKSNIEHSNSFLAQGGISAVIDKDDHWRAHYKDTIMAGQLHNSPETTELLVKEGKEVIKTLSKWGVPFDTSMDGNLLLGKEGGHLFNRIVHAGGDQTGKKVMEVLTARVRNKAQIITGQYAVDLFVSDNKCAGVYCKDNEDNISLFRADHTILAGGGYAGIYAVTSNTYGSDGSAICMAYRAGVELTDLEFVQFHPTLLKDDYNTGLITEAVRGQGGILVNSKGIPVMEGFHPMKDLAPRDFVSRRLYKEIHEHGESVYLNIKEIDQFEERFPGVTALCKKAGISIEEGLIPVSPGAHFTMGGIVADGHGRTSLNGLYAIGECACTGVHGANRLASNSLLEGAVFAKQAAKAILSSRENGRFRLPFIPFEWYLNQTDKTEAVLEADFIRSVMNESAGICRDENQLRNAKELLELMNFKPSLLQQPLSYIKRFNLQTIAWLTVTSCLQRNESKGSHYRTDFPNSSEEWNQIKIIRSLLNDESYFAKEAITGLLN